MDENTNIDIQNTLEDLDDEKRNSKESPKKIEVVTGNGDLTISPVYEHLEVEKPKPKENRTIFIPEVKKDLIKETSDDSKNSDDSESIGNSEDSDDCLDSESLADLENFKNLNNSRNSDD